MIKSETRIKSDFCQSKHFKSWNPDYLSEYSRWSPVTFLIPKYFFSFLSLKDKHLKCYFKKPKARKHLLQIQQVRHLTSKSLCSSCIRSRRTGRLWMRRSGGGGMSSWRGERGRRERTPGGGREEKKRSESTSNLILTPHTKHSTIYRFEVFQKIKQEESERQGSSGIFQTFIEMMSSTPIIFNQKNLSLGWQEEGWGSKTAGARDKREVREDWDWGGEGRECWDWALLLINIQGGQRRQQT